MNPAKLDYFSIHKNSSRVLSRVTAITVVNYGTKAFTVMGTIIEPNSNPWSAPFAGGYKDFDLKHIVFSGINALENHAHINVETINTPCN